jgi:hypothetical protein
MYVVIANLMGGRTEVILDSRQAAEQESARLTRLGLTVLEILELSPSQAGLAGGIRVS